MLDNIPYTDDHNTFRERLRRFLDTEVVPHVDQWEKDQITPRDMWRKIGQNGFLCTAVPREYGGMGGDFLYTVIVIEELMRTNHAGLLMQLHSDVVVPYIEAFGSEAQKGKYLPGCANGDIVTAIAMTEPDAGSDLASMTTTAVEDGDYVVLNGAKTFISNGINCDLVVLAAKEASIDNPHKAISLYLVEDGTPGFQKGNQIEKMGMHSQDTAELFFNNCRVPVENRLGEKGQGFYQLMMELQQERLTAAIMSHAMAKNALAWTKAHCKETFHDGFLKTSSQASLFALVEMETDLRLGEAFLNDLIMAHTRKEEVITETSMAKFWFSEKANHVANRCLELIGDAAAREDCPVVRTWRDLRIQTIFAGTNEIMRQILSKSI